MEKMLVGIFAIIGVVVFVAGFGIVLAFPIKWCWNYTMPMLFELPVITWGQAWCLNFLAGCLIKSTQTNNPARKRIDSSNER